MRGNETGAFVSGLVFGLAAMAIFLGVVTQRPTTITPQRLVRAQEACASNGGLKSWHGTQLICINGATFIID